MIDELTQECADAIAQTYFVEPERMRKAVALLPVVTHMRVQLDKWQVASASNPRTKYRVDMEHLTCTCQDFSNFPNSVCKHIAAVLLTLKVEKEREERASCQVSRIQALDTLIREAGVRSMK
jgi:hypothetical protein